MNTVDYSFIFNDITDSGSNVKMESPEGEVSYSLQIYLNDRAFLSRKCSVYSTILADLVDLAVSVYSADWLSNRKIEKVYKIRITLPVRNPDLLGGERSLDLLKSTLHWFTGDHWQFDFVKREKPGRSAEKQTCIPVNIETEVALWSGGLDSFAGLVNRMDSCRQNNYTLFGTGCNKHINGVQQKLVEELRENFNPRINFIQLPFYINNAKQIHKNSKLRARGFTFLLLGSVCANLENCDRLFIYENGIGAINLSFRASEVGLDHSRSVHPLSLYWMTELLSYWLKTKFYFNNPFLFWTKSQMCKIFKNCQVTNLIPLTISCDSRPRRKGVPIQCGYCSSCILRRQSLAAAKVNDETDYAINYYQVAKPRYRLHFEAMQYQVETLRAIVNSDNPWYYITKKFHDLLNITDLIENKHSEGSLENMLLHLYSQYVKEWDSINDVLCRNLK